MSANAEMVKRWFQEVWCEPRNAAAIDDMLLEGAKLYGVNAAKPMTKEDFKRVQRHFVTQFPNIRFDVTHMIESGEWVAFHAQVSGNHAETGLPVQFGGTGLAQLRDGQIVESHETWDFASMLAQIGAIPVDVIARELTGA